MASSGAATWTRLIKHSVIFELDHATTAIHHPFAIQSCLSPSLMAIPEDEKEDFWVISLDSIEREKVVEYLVTYQKVPG